MKNYKTNNTPATTTTTVVDKFVNNIAAEISAAADITGISVNDIITKLVTKLSVDIHTDIDTDIRMKNRDINTDVPVLSGNYFNISIGNITYADRGGSIGDNKKKGGKKKKNKKK